MTDAPTGDTTDITPEELQELIDEGQMAPPIPVPPPPEAVEPSLIPIPVTVITQDDDRFAGSGPGFAAYTAAGVFATGKWEHGSDEDAEEDILFPYTSIKRLIFRTAEFRKLIEDEVRAEEEAAANEQLIIPDGAKDAESDGESSSD